MEKYDIIIVGGGAAGLMAAANAAKRNKSVLLIEQKDSVGKKILITGKGRCNITNGCDIEDIFNNIPRNKNFMYSSIYSFSNSDIIEYFETLGVKTKEERGKRIFPQSDTAMVVKNALLHDCKSSGVKIVLDVKVEKILIKNKKVIGIKTKQDEILCSSVIMACGGSSYPTTGSDGNGFEIAKKAGHSIVPLKAGLTGLNTKESWTKNVMGITLKNVALKGFYKNKLIYEDVGEMLFTHFGISGPLVLTASRHFLDYDFKDTKVKIDLKPGLSDEKLYNRIGRDFAENGKKQLINSLNKLLPSSLIPQIVEISNIKQEKPVNQISKEEKMNLVHTLKNLKLTIASSRGLREAIVTCGGVNVKEIDPSTMESKIVKGLYFAGEMIDVDGYTGGYNLTIAFSTGHLAGENA